MFVVLAAVSKGLNVTRLRDFSVVFLPRVAFFWVGITWGVDVISFNKSTCARIC